MHTKFWLENLKGIYHLRNVGVDGRIILNVHFSCILLWLFTNVYKAEVPSHTTIYFINNKITGAPCFGLMRPSSCPIDILSEAKITLYLRSSKTRYHGAPICRGDHFE
jgi:hypothetical protein